ncbi:hypothetical protein [Streptomyces sp. NPDC046939]|uniref:hypothetical protein n=1 Tax=Streptomyces sp. NPDC046939 TaxID=3155376 RepID=UPI0033D7052B
MNTEHDGDRGDGSSATTIVNLMDENERGWLKGVPEDRAARYLQTLAEQMKRDGLTLESEAGKHALHYYIQLAREEESNTRATENKNWSRW